MATRVSTAWVQKSDPGDGALSPDRTTSNKAANDIGVSFSEGQVLSDGKGGNYLQLVMTISADDGATASTDGNGGTSITATNRAPITQYVVCNMNSVDPNNWSLSVGTSGGSSYTFTKGNGGGGR